MCSGNVCVSMLSEGGGSRVQKTGSHFETLSDGPHRRRRGLAGVPQVETTSVHQPPSQQDQPPLSFRLPRSHVVNLLGNLPLPCLDVLLIPKVQQGSTEYMGVNMDAVDMLLDFMERRLDRVSFCPRLHQLTFTIKLG